MRITDIIPVDPADSIGLIQVCTWLTADILHNHQLYNTHEYTLYTTRFY